MSTAEQERVQRIMDVKSRGDRVGQRLGWDPRSKKIKAFSSADPDRAVLEIDRSDMDHFGCIEGHAR